MSARKTERLMNLLIMLLNSRGYVTKQRLRESFPEYAAARTDEAFEKMFERDKDDLRALGVPIEVGSHDAYFEDEPGYRIPRQEFELPPIALEADEAAVCGLAARVWQHAGLADSTEDALRKLAADGVETDRSAQALIAAPQLDADEPAVEVFMQAVSERRVVHFGYRKSPAAPVEARRLEPWRLVSYRGRWYVVGRDQVRGAQRTFRISRVAEDAELVGEPGAFAVPDGVDMASMTRHLAADTPEREAVVRVREGRGITLRRRALAIEPDGDGWERVTVPLGRVSALVSELARLGDQAVAVAPDDVREALVQRLTAAAGTTVAP
jgi:proteasome accessory factor B